MYFFDALVIVYIDVMVMSSTVLQCLCNYKEDGYGPA